MRKTLEKTWKQAGTLDSAEIYPQILLVLKGHQEFANVVLGRHEQEGVVQHPIAVFVAPSFQEGIFGIRNSCHRNGSP